MYTKMMLTALLGCASLASLAGCAPAYHSYSACYVPCGYCAPPPLPYTHFTTCGCSMCEAMKSVDQPPEVLEPSPETVGP